MDVLTADEIQNDAYWFRRLNHVVDGAGGKVEQWPTLAAEVSITTNTTWGSSAYTQFFAASVLTVPFMVIGLAVAIRGNSQGEIDIAVGAATSEVVIGTLRTGTLLETGGVTGPIWLPFAYPPYAPANARLAARTRTQDTNSRITGIYAHTQRISSRSGRIKDIVGLSTVVQAVQPAAADSTSATSSATSYTYGSYAEVIASTSGAQTLVGVYTIPWSLVLGANKRALLQVAIGAATSEVVIWEGASLTEWVSTGGQVDSIAFTIPNPLYIASGTRIAIRCANGNASAKTHLAALNLVPYPMR